MASNGANIEVQELYKPKLTLNMCGLLGRNEALYRAQLFPVTNDFSQHFSVQMPT